MSFFEELKRRNVFRVAVAYAVSAWVVLQVADLVLDNIEAPAWVMSVFMLVAGLGFIVALVISWAYEVTPEGIKRESEVQKDQSITHHTAKRLDKITLAAVAVLALLIIGDRFLGKDAPGENPVSSSPAVDEAAPTSSGLSSEATEPVPAPAEPAISRQSIAVLPLANRSVNAEDAFFAEGIHDEILTRLSRIADLKVISRTSVMSYAGTNKKMAEIGQELGVAHLLEGGVQRAGDRVRINVQLIEAQTDRHLWAEVYDRELTADNLFDIQSEITRSISDQLKAVLSGEELETLASRPTDNVEAYAYYLRAKAMAAGYGRPNDVIRDSIKVYESALELDPGFAAAWAALATDWTELHWGTSGLEGERDQAEAALARAKALAPDTAETLIAEGYLRYWGYLDYEPALEAFRAALQKKPGSVLALRGMAYTLRRMGQLDQAIAKFRQAIELDPNDPGMPADLGYTLIHRGKFQEAEVMFRRSITQDPDNQWNRWSFMGYFLMLNDPAQALHSYGLIESDTQEGYLSGTYYAARVLGDEQKMAEALEIWKKVESIEGLSIIARALWLYAEGDLDSIRASLQDLEQGLLEAADRSPDPDVPLSNLILLYGLLGDEARLETAIQRFDTELKPDAMRIVEDLSRPMAWAMVGNKDRALSYAEEMVEQFGIWEFSTFVQDPVFDSLRGEPRFKELALRYDRWLETIRGEVAAR